MFIIYPVCEFAYEEESVTGEEERGGEIQSYYDSLYYTVVCCRRIILKRKTKMRLYPAKPVSFLHHLYLYLRYKMSPIK